MANEKLKKVEKKYFCEKCRYSTSVKYCYDKHILTLKHKMLKNANKKLKKNECPDKPYICDCGRCYKHQASLTRHRKQCESVTSETDDLKMIVNELKELKEENKELKEAICKQQQQIGNMAPKIGNTIINNKNFNINIFLNEQCQDALNMSDFIESLQIQIDDLDYTKTNGMVEGVGVILANRLKELDTFKRPIHCTDMKRETLYIKDNDEWDKEENGKNKLRQVINNVANKQRDAIIEMDQMNPKKIASEKDKDDYIQFVKNVMSDVSETSNENKIIKKIAKETLIDKD